MTSPTPSGRCLGTQSSQRPGLTWDASGFQHQTVRRGGSAKISCARCSLRQSLCVTTPTFHRSGSGVRALLADAAGQFLAKLGQDAVGDLLFMVCAWACFFGLLAWTFAPVPRWAAIIALVCGVATPVVAIVHGAGGREPTGS